MKTRKEHQEHFTMNHLPDLIDLLDELGNVRLKENKIEFLRNREVVASYWLAKVIRLPDWKRAIVQKHSIVASKQNYSIDNR